MNYEKDRTLIDAGIYWNNDGSMKDIDFQNEPIPRQMMYELYVRLKAFATQTLDL